MRLMTTGLRLAILLDDGTLLAVPPMRPDLPSAVRVRVFEYVLRGQLGLAETVVQIESDRMDSEERHDRRLIRYGHAPEFHDDHAAAA
jgi:hypothetical protein